MIALSCVIVVVLRIGGTHLHLCFDGSEPPVSLHLPDSGLHHAEDPATSPHADQDVSIGAEALVKKSWAALDVAALAFVFMLLFFLPRLRNLLPAFFAPPRISPARIRLRPPLRGPPLRLPRR